jgi:hypothetical protein
VKFAIYWKHDMAKARLKRGKTIILPSKSHVKVFENITTGSVRQPWA